MTTKLIDTEQRFFEFSVVEIDGEVKINSCEMVLGGIFRLRIDNSGSSHTRRYGRCIQFNPSFEKFILKQSFEADFTVYAKVKNSVDTALTFLFGHNFFYDGTDNGPQAHSYVIPQGFFIDLDAIVIQMSLNIKRLKTNHLFESRLGFVEFEKTNNDKTSIPETDATLQGTYKLHKSILTRASKVFLNAFNAQMSESSTNNINILNSKGEPVSKEALEFFIASLYFPLCSVANSSKLCTQISDGSFNRQPEPPLIEMQQYNSPQLLLLQDEKNVDLLLEVLEIAHQYDVVSILTKVVNLLLSCMSYYTVLKIYEKGCLYEISKLTKACFPMIWKNIQTNTADFHFDFCDIAKKYYKQPDFV